MKHYLFIILLFLSSSLWAQNMLVLERPGTVKNHIYYAGNNISIKTTEGLKISGPINIIRRDSTIVVDFVHELKLSDIEMVYKSRSLMKLGGTALIGGSALYLGLDLINSGNVDINQSFWVSIGVAATGVALLVFSKKKMRIEENKWRLKVLVE